MENGSRSVRLTPLIELILIRIGRRVSHVANSQRFAYNARSYFEDLESRRGWPSNHHRKFPGDGFVVLPVSDRGKETELAILASWGPAFAAIQWELEDECMHIAARPSPLIGLASPNQAPAWWRDLVMRENRLYMANRHMNRIPISPASSQAGGIATHVAQDEVIHNVGTQSAEVYGVGASVSPGLSQLSDILAIYRPTRRYSPEPAMRDFSVSGKQCDSCDVMVRPVRPEEVAPVALRNPEGGRGNGGRMFYDALPALPIPPRNGVCVAS